MEELEKAKLLSVATKLTQAQIQEVREELLEQLNSIQIPEAINGLDGRGITDARIFEGQLIFQLSDGVLVTAGSVMGEQGPVGLTGAQGEKGDKGEQGPTGDTGATGEIGLEGPRGVKGDKGDKGDTGQQGERGEQGEQGVPGQRGQRGERGEQGTSGIDGAAGRDGRNGAKGETGETGPQGVPGRDGKNGKNGKDGTQGLKGDKGDKGDSGEKGDKGDPGSDADVSKLEKKLNEFSDQVDKRLSKVAFNVAAKGGGGPAGSGEVLLHRLDDVDYASVKTPSNGQSLVWNSSISKWKASSDVSVGTLTISGAIVPSGNTPISIGSPSSPFGSLYLSSNTIYIGDAAISSNGPKLIIPNETFFANGIKVGTTLPDIITANGTVNLNPYLQVANANAKFATKAYAASNTYVNNKFTTKAYAAANSYVNTINTSKANYYYSNTMYNYTQYGLGYMNVAPNQNPTTLAFRTDVPAPPFGSIWILAVNDGLVDPAPITIYSPNTRTTPMLWMSIDGSGPFSDANPNGQAYWFNITPPPSGA
jgi:hypothetical protein